ncbi:MAG: hypothetical protein JNJ58_12490 [Chitinophagaceae bacterium]|nr:hypothetical protein [Chitinophagaceae bacterium]
MSYRFSVYRQVSELPPEWDQQMRPDYPMHSRELSIQEMADLDHLEYYYVITYENDQPVMYSYYQHLHVTPEHFNCKDKIFQHYSLNISLRIVKPSLLVVGNLFRHDAPYTYFIDHSLSIKKKADIYIKAYEYMLDHAKATGIFLKDVQKEIAPYVQSDNTYHQLQDDVSMYFNVPPEWKSMADYEKILKHKYLQRYKKIGKQLDGIVVQELNTEDIIKHADAIESLYLQVTNKQLVSMGKLKKSFFILLKKQLGERYKVFGWFLDGSMVAFSSAILHDGYYDMNYIGFDYAINQSHAIYLNILFHCMQQAIATQSKRLVVGRTALEAKAILGCEPEYMFGFYKLRHVLVNWFFKRVSAGFRDQIGEKWKERHPFKSSYYQ